METLKTFLLHIFWPVKGIIYLEVYLLTWIFWMSWVYFSVYGVILLIVATVLFALAVTFNRVCQLRRAGARLAGAVFHSVIGVITAIFRAWWYLLVGVVNGRVATAADQHLPRSIRFDHGRFRRRRLNNDELPLHYLLGRGLYRLFYRLIALIPGLNGHQNVVATIARILGLVVVLWGVWDIPRFLTT